VRESVRAFSHFSLLSTHFSPLTSSLAIRAQKRPENLKELQAHTLSLTSHSS
jgi:hypothetical protein